MSNCVDIDLDKSLIVQIYDLQQENQKLKAELQLYQGALKREHEAIHRVNDLEEVIDKAIEYIETHKRKDEFLELNEWGTRELLDILKEVK